MKNGKIMRFLIKLPVLRELNSSGLFGEIECAKRGNSE